MQDVEGDFQWPVCLQNAKAQQQMGNRADSPIQELWTHSSLLIPLRLQQKAESGKGLQSSSPLGHAIVSQHIFDHTRYVRRSLEDISNLRPFKGRTKVSKKETCCLCPFLLHTYYIAHLLCWAVSLERVEGHPPSSHRILFIWSQRIMLTFVKIQSKVSTSRRDFHVGFM